MATEFDDWQAQSIAEFSDEPMRSLILNLHQRLTALENMTQSQPTTESSMKANPSDVVDWQAVANRVETMLDWQDNHDWIHQGMASTTPTTPGSSQSAPNATPISPAEPNSECAHEWKFLRTASFGTLDMVDSALVYGARWCQLCGVLEYLGRIHAPHASAPTSTSRRPELQPSAAPAQAVAP